MFVLLYHHCDYSGYRSWFVLTRLIYIVRKDASVCLMTQDFDKIKLLIMDWYLSPKIGFIDNIDSSTTYLLVLGDALGEYLEVKAIAFLR